MKYYDDGTVEEGLQSETSGTFTFDADLIYIVRDTRFNREDTLRIDATGNLNMISGTLVNCEQHAVYSRL